MIEYNYHGHLQEAVIILDTLFEIDLVLDPLPLQAKIDSIWTRGISSQIQAA